MTEAKIAQKIATFIQKHAGSKSAVLGLSGGVDSAVVAGLAVRALGASRVLGVIMPSATNSNSDERLARQLAKQLGIKTVKVNVDKIIDAYKLSTGIFKDKKSLGNLKARVRMSVLYGWANKLNALVLGTGNKSELMAGYFTKYGDGGVDILPIADLYKTQVRALARYLNIPAEIIERAPTAGLWAGQTDEGEMGITYENLDKILSALEIKKSLKNFSVKEVALVKKMIGGSAHKRALAPVCKVL